MTQPGLPGAVYGLLWLNCLLLVALLVLSLSQRAALRENFQQPRQTIFQRTISDAALSDEKRIVRTLFALNDANALLQWQDFATERHVKAVAWMNQAAFERYYQGKQLGTAPPEGVGRVWITLAPQVRQFCRSLAVDDPRFRLQQYLGLDPNRSYERFVELWLRPADIFRPCADPEPNDSACDLAFNRQRSPRVAGITDYPAYFRRLVEESYTPTGAPWTRLGYTYDWAYGDYGVGASEYIIVPGAQFRIGENYSTGMYCSSDQGR